MINYTEGLSIQFQKKQENSSMNDFLTFKNGSIGGGLPTNIQILTYCDNNNNTYTKTRSKIGNNSYSEWK